MSELVANFATISLGELNNKSALLERWDSKYVLSGIQVLNLLEFARPQFDVLAINGLRQFGYRSIYFDSADLHTFRHHNQGRRRRIKVRRRQYLDSGGSFFEVKIKGLRKKTHKYRLKIAASQIDNIQLLPEEFEFLQRRHRKHYQRPWPYVMSPSITVDYRRITLVAKHGSERLTFDQNIEFFDSHRHCQLPPEKWIVEVKAPKFRSAVHGWLVRQGIRPAKRCAKYAMGVSLLKYPQNNRFRPVLKQKFFLESPVCINSL